MSCAATPPAPTRALLFDLGGVVLHVDFERALQAWAPHSRLPLARLRELFHFDAPYQQHETGRLAAGAYFEHLRALLQLDCDAAAVRAGFNAVLQAEIAPTLELIDAVRHRVPCHAISNTNAVHVAEIERLFPGLLRRFERVFTSHEIGERKPHPRTFTHVLAAIGVPAPEVVLFDDLVSNIEAARALGLQAVLVRGPADVREALLARGLLPAAA
ncbi:MAG: haloacid dehalogenase-like hydrolase [Ramlibacter sp.]|nr:haloacid dehalogenase-like hydrolase [Ramlibacter sp.]